MPSVLLMWLPSFLSLELSNLTCHPSPTSTLPPEMDLSFASWPFFSTAYVKEGNMGSPSP